MTDITTGEMWVQCENCDHQWVAMHLPMEMSKAAKIINLLICPKCAEGSHRIFICQAPEKKDG